MSTEYKLQFTGAEINEKLGQIANKQNTIKGAASTITNSNLNADKVLVSDGSGKVSASNVTSAELGYLTGVTGNVQEGLDNANMLAALAMDGSLKWDGVIGDKEHIIVEQADGFNVCFVRISDECPIVLESESSESVAFAIVGFSEYGTQIAESVEFEVQDDGFAIITECFVLVPQDNYTFDGLTFTKKGVWVMALHCAQIGYDFSVAYGSGLWILGCPFTESDGADKYFENVVVENNVREIKDTLTFDGNISNKETVFVGRATQDGSTLEARYVKISNSVPTVNDFANGAISCHYYTGQETSVIISSDSINDLFKDDGLCTFDYVVIIPYDNYTITEDDVSLTFPKKGIYTQHVLSNNVSMLYTCSLTIPNYTFIVSDVSEREVIKTEHLPEALQFGEIETTTSVNLGDTITWDGISGENIAAALGATVVRIADCTLTPEELAAKQITAIDNNGNLISAYVEQLETLIVIGNDECGVYVSCSNNNTVFGITFPTAGFYFINFNGNYISSLTISGYNFVGTKETTELVPVNHKYLPKALQFGHIGEKVSVGDTLVYDEISGEVVYDKDGIWITRIADCSLTYEEIMQKQMTGVTKNGLQGSVNVSGSDSHITTISLTDDLINILGAFAFITYQDNAVVLDAILPKAGLYFTNCFTDYFTSLTISDYDFIVPKPTPINEAYIPKTIARTNCIPAIANVTSAPTAEQFNALLDALRAAGLMATE